MKTKFLNVELPEETMKSAKKRAIECGMTLKQFIDHVIKNEVEKDE